MLLLPASWLVVDTSFRASVAILLLLCLRPILRRWIGSRALAWLWLAIAARLLFPVPVSAPWHFPSPLPVPATATASPFGFRVFVSSAGTLANPGVAAHPRLASPSQIRRALNILPLLWLAGVALAAARLARGWWTARRWAAQTLLPDTEPLLPPIYLALPAALRRGVALRLTDAIDTPTLVGVLHPQIWLPRTLPDALTPAELRHVLLHELGHACRRDLLAQWFCSLACCLHWFNPLVWLLAHRARTDRELACDAWVLARLATEPETTASYGHTLLKVVEGMGHGTPRALPLVSMAAGKRHLGLRVREIRAFRPVAPWRGAVALVVTTALVAALSGGGAAAESGTGAVGSNPRMAPPPPPPPLSSPAGIPPEPVLPTPPAPDPSGPLPLVQIESKFIEMTKSGVSELEKSFPRSSPAASVAHQLFAWSTAQPSSAPTAIFRSSLVLPDDFGVFVRQLNQTKGVDLLSAPRVTTKSGQKATIEIIREFVYPTAFERGRDPAGRPQASPTSFDKTNTGVTLEVCPTVASKRDVIDLSIAWRITNFDGFVGDDGQPVPAKVAGTGVEFPVFDTHSVNTVASLYSGATLIFSTDGRYMDVQKSFQPAASQAQRKVLPKKDDERLLLIFVTARFIDTPPASPAKTPGADAHPPVPGTSGTKAATRPSSPPTDSSPATPPVAASPDPAAAAAPLSFGVPVPGKPGFVTSPYAPDAGYVDLHGFTRGQFVRDPYTGKLFRVP